MHQRESVVAYVHLLSNLVQESKFIPQQIYKLPQNTDVQDAPSE